MTITIDYERMKTRCLARIQDFDDEGDYWETPDTHRGFVYKDNGQKILAVAHLDTVAVGTHFERCVIDGTELIFNRQADDRVGAYILLDLIPSILGYVPYDILLTTGEESGQSTATIFNCQEPGYYRWIIEADRNGEDVVGYDYQRDPKWTEYVKSVGWTPGHGSFTDICALYRFNALAFNFGVGYEENHGRFARIDIDMLKRCVERMVAFIKLYKDTDMPFDPKAFPAPTYVGWSSNRVWVKGKGWIDDKDDDGVFDWEGYYERHPYTPVDGKKETGADDDTKPSGARVYATCSNCGKSFSEPIAKMGANLPTTCPACRNRRTVIVADKAMDYMATDVSRGVMEYLYKCACCGRHFWTDHEYTRRTDASPICAKCEDEPLYATVETILSKHRCEVCQKEFGAIYKRETVCESCIAKMGLIPHLTSGDSIPSGLYQPLVGDHVHVTETITAAMLAKDGSRTKIVIPISTEGTVEQVTNDDWSANVRVLFPTLGKSWWLPEEVIEPISSDDDTALVETVQIEEETE